MSRPCSCFTTTGVTIRTRLLPRLRLEKVAPAKQQWRSSLVLGFRCQEKEVLSADTRHLPQLTTCCQKNGTKGLVNLANGVVSFEYSKEEDLHAKQTKIFTFNHFIFQAAGGTACRRFPLKKIARLGSARRLCRANLGSQLNRIVDSGVAPGVPAGRIMGPS